MVKMVEVIVTDRSGKIIKRVAVNEDLFNYVLEKSRENSLDLATAWFIRELALMFTPTTAGGSVSITYTDTGGTSRSQLVKANYGTQSIIFNTGSCNNRLWIGYGNSSTASTRYDYKLGNKLAEAVAGVSYDETGGTVTISASFTMSADTTIYEVGLEWEGCIASYNVCGRILLDRTVFSDGITVLAGQTITIVYRFFFP